MLRVHPLFSDLLWVLLHLQAQRGWMQLFSTKPLPEFKSCSDWEAWNRIDVSHREACMSSTPSVLRTPPTLPKVAQLGGSKVTPRRGHEHASITDQRLLSCMSSTVNANANAAEIRRALA